VRLNLVNEADVGQAAAELFTLSDQLYLETMKPAVAELIVGVTRDPQFGLVLTIGSGGILVEILKFRHGAMKLKPQSRASNPHRCSRAIAASPPLTSRPPSMPLLRSSNMQSRIRIH
jgi:hypothetical protein